MWAANLAAIEFHVPLWHPGDGGRCPRRPTTWCSTSTRARAPTIVECCPVARWIAELLEPRDHECLAKTSGSKGLQLYVPLGSPTDLGARSRRDAHDIAGAARAGPPRLVVSNMRKELRSGKVLIDWSQNHPAKTTVAVYSLRARSEPTVSTPVTWDEVEECARRAIRTCSASPPTDVLDRVERRGTCSRTFEHDGTIASFRARQPSFLPDPQGPLSCCKSDDWFDL